MAGEASADTCSHLGASGDWNSGLSWDCGHLPGPADTAIVGAGDHPIVASDPIPEPGLVAIGDNGRIVFQNEAELRVGDMSVTPAPSPAPGRSWSRTSSRRAEPTSA